MDWTLEDTVDGLFFCATLTGRRGGHTPFVQAGVEKSDIGAEAVKLDRYWTVFTALWVLQSFPFFSYTSGSDIGWLRCWDKFCWVQPWFCSFLVHKRSLVAQGAMPPKIFSIPSHFVLWEAVPQTNYCFSPKIKNCGPPKILAWLRHCLGVEDRMPLTHIQEL